MDATGDSPSPPSTPTAGTKLGDYRIERLLGRGGMGAVYLAYDAKLRRQIALKTLDASVDSQVTRVQLLREARNAAALNHPNICTIHEVDEANGTAFIAMEYVEGRSLADRLHDGRLPLDDAIQYGIEAADALAYAHERGVVHRDFKSANAMLTTAGRLKIVDFGLARRDDVLAAPATTVVSIAGAGLMAGTPYAMAPEQVRGEPADARTDIWALGVLLYEMVTGTRPFSAPTVPELFSAILRDPPTPPRTRLPEELRSVIGRCLEKEPARRYQTGRELKIALEGIGGRRPRYRLAVQRLQPRSLALTAAAIVIMMLGVVGFVWLRDRFAASPLVIQSLAVLPFENLSPNLVEEYFAHGIQEALIADLSRISALKVISRASTVAYATPGKPVRDIAAALHVEGIVRGSVQRTGERVQIAVQLVHVPDEVTLWSERFDRDLREALTLQNELARSIVRALNAQITSAEAGRLGAQVSVNPDALDLYLRAKPLLHPGGAPDGPRRALQLFRASVDKEPGFALGYAGISAAYAFLGNGGFQGVQGAQAEPAAQAFDRSEAAARHALELDPTLAEAHVSLAIVRFTHYDWVGGMDECRRALELNPNLPDARFWLAYMLTATGRRDEALVQARKAEELDPISEILGTVLYRSRLYEEAFGEQRRVLDAGGPDGIRLTLSRLYLRMQRYPEAMKELEQLGPFKATPGAAAEMRVAFDARGGQGLAAWLAEFFQRQTFRPVAPGNIAWFYAMAGNKERAFAMLDRGYAENSLPGAWMLDDPGWDPIRGDSRFRELVRLINLPESLTRVPDSERIRIDAK
jgi:eukaryotic-like serine/threonine-protein kinase